MVEVERETDNIKSLYRAQVLSGRTRTVELLGRKCRPEILRTFLGLEVKAGRKRITCPDLSTARYLKIFAELGLESVEIPYDPTVTARILPELERSFQGLKRRIRQEPLHQTQRAMRVAFAKLRSALRAGS